MRYCSTSAVHEQPLGIAGVLGTQPDDSLLTWTHIGETSQIGARRGKPATPVESPFSIDNMPFGDADEDPKRELYRVGPNCETWPTHGPNTLAENPY
jgi:hypothetical protein